MAPHPRRTRTSCPAASGREEDAGTRSTSWLCVLAQAGTADALASYRDQLPGRRPRTERWEDQARRDGATKAGALCVPARVKDALRRDTLHRMDKKPLGRSGVDLPEVGFGTWEFRGDAVVIHRALDLGAFLIDTAESYGTEGRVGSAIAARRGEVFLATKVSPWHFRHADVLTACDRSLTALGVETIDLYQLHAPSHDIPIEETMGAMADLVASGKVRHVGVSNFSVAEMEAAQAALGTVPIVENQIKYSLFDHDFADTVIPYCEEHGMTVLAYSSLEQGAFQSRLQRNPELVEVMGGVCAETGRTAPQVLLNWTLRSPVVITIPKTNTLARVDENCGAAGWRLTDAQWQALTDAAGPSRSSFWWR